MKATKRSKGAKRATKQNGVSVMAGGSRIGMARVRLDQRSTTQVADTQRFLKRLTALEECGLPKTHLTTIVGVSYSAMHGFITGRISPSLNRLKEYNKRIDAWCKQVRKV